MGSRWPYFTAAGLLALLILLASQQSSRFDLSTWSGGPSTEHHLKKARFAYASYAADTDALCHAMMMFDRLRELQVDADLVLLYSDTLIDPEATTMINATAARWNVQLRSAPVLETTTGGGLDGMYVTSGLKLQLLWMDLYDRIIYLDTDATLYKSLDHLFHLPQTDLALTRAYWLQAPWYHSALLVIKPSQRLYNKFLSLLHDPNLRGYDMELINWLCGLHGVEGSSTFGSPHCLILPHRPYTMLSLEFREASHDRWLGFTEDRWDAQAELDALHYLHFSGQTKPWRFNTMEEMEEEAPDCGAVRTCSARRIWLEAQVDFRRRRSEVCGADF